MNSPSAWCNTLKTAVPEQAENALQKLDAMLDDCTRGDPAAWKQLSKLRMKILWGNK